MRRCTYFNYYITDDRHLQYLGCDDIQKSSDARIKILRHPKRTDFENVDGKVTDMLNHKNWITNMESAATEASKLLGWEIEDLNPAYYSEVFDELDFMANDARD